MSLEDLGNIGEFVAAVAVIVSLIYLAVRIRQNTRVLCSATHQAWAYHGHGCRAVAAKSSVIHFAA
jgi:hypothetical protein